MFCKLLRRLLPTVILEHVLIVSSMVFITAGFGGFYVRTIWPVWSLNVVIIQQLNLFLSSEITGINVISAIERFRKWKHLEPWYLSQTRTRLTSEEQFFSQNDPDESALQDEWKGKAHTELEIVVHRRRDGESVFISEPLSTPL